MKRHAKPRTLGWDLALAILLANLVVLGGAATLLRWQDELTVRASARERAHGRIEQLDAFLQMRTRELDEICAAYVRRRGLGLYSREVSPPPPAWVDAELEEPLANAADTAVWVGDGGSVVWSLGDEADVRRLREYAEGDAAPSFTGRIALSRGPAIAAVHRTESATRGPSAAFLALAGDAHGELAAEFAKLNNVASAVVTASVQPPGEEAGSLEGYRDINYHLEDGALESSAIMLDSAGRPAGVVLVTEPYPPVAPSAMSWQLTVAGSLALAALAGLVGGILTSRAARRPVRALAEHVRALGEQAAGGPAAPHPAPPEAIPAELHSILEVVEALVDRLARRQAELEDAIAQAKEAEERLRTAVDDSTEGKVLLQGHVVRLANPAAAAHMGTTVERLMGADLPPSAQHAVFTDDGGRVLQFDELMRRAAAGPLTVSTAANDGNHWLEVRTIAHPERGEMLFTSRDVTDARRLEQMREEVFSLVSHDLRSPLAVMSGYLDIIGKHECGDVTDKALAGARASVEHMLSLLEDLLAATDAEGLFAPGTASPVQIDSLAAEVVAGMRTTMPQSIDLRITCSPTVRGEARRLRQALTNMLANAAKYSPAASVVTVTIECFGDRVRLSVEDQGPGIAPADRERVFERFVRLRGDSETRDGVGLGLYIVKAIAEAHGGSVRIEDGPSGGARFVLELPGSEAPEDGA